MKLFRFKKNGLLYVIAQAGVRFASVKTAIPYKHDVQIGLKSIRRKGEFTMAMNMTHFTPVATNAFRPTEQQRY